MGGDGGRENVRDDAMCNGRKCRGGPRKSRRANYGLSGGPRQPPLILIRGGVVSNRFCGILIEASIAPLRPEEGAGFIDKGWGTVGE